MRSLSCLGVGSSGRGDHGGRDAGKVEEAGDV